MEREEIIKAVRTIKEICGKYEACYYCPFCTSSDGCVINGKIPRKWEIKREDIWRVFE